MHATTTRDALRRFLPALLVLAVPSAAFAHPGHGDADGFAAGIAHPLGGLDHVCAMFAVGLWAAQQRGRATWLVPTAFVGVMLVGGALGMSGVALPFVESGIAASALVLGALVAAAVRLPTVAGAALVGLLALFHGHAHGAEAPTSASGAAYAAGFVVSTALLHAAGIGAALLVGRAGHQRLVRIAGAVFAACGVALLFA